MNSNESIIFRGGLTMSGIVLLALLSMISSVFIAESTKGDATAINLAGSLRMQSYRIATRLQQPTKNDAEYAEDVVREINEFERRLAQLWQTKTISPKEVTSESKTLIIIESFWHDAMKPTLRNLTKGKSLPATYLSQVDDFVAELDAFVKLLEQSTEAKILLLRLIQGIALFLTLVLIFAAMYQLHTTVVVPLRDLVELAKKARHGDLSVRASHVGDDELGVLGHAFNLMTADLSAMYAELEARVAQQTQALRISNRSLELLYNTARRLGETSPMKTTYQALVEDIETLTGMELGSVTLCMIHPNTQHATEVFSTQPRTQTIPPFCHRPDCNACLGDGITHSLDSAHDVFSIPIKIQEQQFGVLIVRDPNLGSRATWQLPLLEVVARNIAAALRANEKTENHQRLALLEERGAIARELHDSLAQSLSYLKIQISRLQAQVGKTKTSTDVQDIVTDLREGLNSAYRQVRELITTFRLKLEHPRLEDSLQDLVREFSHRGQIPIELNHFGWDCALDPNEQIHVMQLIREALNNAVRHARPHQIEVRLCCADNGEAMVEVVDDGIGLPANPERDQHFGLNIMRERAHQLGGKLDFESGSDGGLQVQLRFTPNAHKIAPTESTPEVQYV